MKMQQQGDTFFPLEDGVPSVGSIGSQVMDWSVRAVHAETAWKRTRGEKIVVGVLDTGWARHPDCDPLRFIPRSIEGFPPGQDWDFHGHGTHVAGIIGATDNDRGVVGIAPGAEIRMWRCVPSVGPGQVAACIRTAALECDVLNLSLGSYNDSVELRESVRFAAKTGCILVAAAGNKPDRVAFPAAYPEVIAVSALGENLSRASFAPLVPNHIALPGVSILSCWINNDYARVSGTSQAAPILSGMIALLLALYRPPKLRAAATVHRQLSRITGKSADMVFYAPTLERL